MGRSDGRAHRYSGAAAEPRARQLKVSRHAVSTCGYSPYLTRPGIRWTAPPPTADTGLMIFNWSPEMAIRRV